MPDLVKNSINGILDPTTFFLISVVLFVAMIVLRERWTRPRVAFSILAATVFLFVWSLTDRDFVRIVAKPDNVAISLLLLSTAIVLWAAFRKMATNDGLIARGQPTFEARESRKRVLCWPDLLYSEFIWAIFVTVGLFVWAYFLEAPLEEPAHPSKTTNPAKAPWYFVGLQELLVYFDSWLAGVAFPTLIIIGLIAIPFLDLNPKGNGYYTFRERPLAITGFLFGFLMLWLLLIVVGTYLRGPNWTFYAPFEHWDPLRVEPIDNVNLSEYVYGGLLDSELPSSPLVRELPGILLVLGYLFVTPWALSRGIFREQRSQMGFVRYHVALFLLLAMLALPIKMVLRWALDVKYVVALPEWYLNV